MNGCWRGELTLNADTIGSLHLALVDEANWKQWLSIDHRYRVQRLACEAPADWLEMMIQVANKRTYSSSYT